MLPVVFLDNVYLIIPVLFVKSLVFYVIVAEHPSVSLVIYVSKSSVVNSRQGLSESAADFGFLIPKYISFFDEFFKMPLKQLLHYYHH